MPYVKRRPAPMAPDGLKRDKGGVNAENQSLDVGLRFSRCMVCH